MNALGWALLAVLVYMAACGLIATALNVILGGVR